VASDKREFQDLARDPRGNLLTEFFAFLRDNKKWWLLPMFLVILLLGGLVLLGGTGLAPFIYTLF
jgi:Family of unknown function (DUF5989)